MKTKIISYIIIWFCIVFTVLLLTLKSRVHIDYAGHVIGTDDYIYVGIDWIVLLLDVIFTSIIAILLIVIYNKLSTKVIFVLGLLFSILGLVFLLTPLYSSIFFIETFLFELISGPSYSRTLNTVTGYNYPFSLLFYLFLFGILLLFIPIIKKLLSSLTKKRKYIFVTIFIILLIYMFMSFRVTQSILCTIRYPGDSEDCLNQTLAILSGNYSLCAKMRENFAKEACYLYFFNTRKSEDICKQIKDNQRYIDKCYLNTAIVTNNGSLCNKIINNSSKDVCFSGIGIQLKDTTYCSKAVDNYHKGDCYKNIAIERNDLTLCELSDIYRDRCIWEIALKRKDATLCLVLSEDKRGECQKDIEGKLPKPAIF